jgi:hypothetical protein
MTVPGNPHHARVSIMLKSFGTSGERLRWMSPPPQQAALEQSLETVTARADEQGQRIDSLEAELRTLRSSSQADASAVAQDLARAQQTIKVTLMVLRRFGGTMYVCSTTSRCALPAAIDSRLAVVNGMVLLGLLMMLDWMELTGDMKEGGDEASAVLAGTAGEPGLGAIACGGGDGQAPFTGTKRSLLPTFWPAYV